MTASVAPVTITAKEPSSSNLRLIVLVSVPFQKPVPDEVSSRLAMRTSFLFDPHSIFIEFSEVATVIVSFRRTHNMQVLLAESLYYAFFLFNEKRTE